MKALLLVVSVLAALVSIVPDAAAYCGAPPPEGVTCCSGVQVGEQCILEPPCGVKPWPPCPMAAPVRLASPLAALPVEIGAPGLPLLP